MNANQRSHLLLLNPSGEKHHFDASRAFKPSSINQKPASAYTAQKVILSEAFENFEKESLRRNQRRTINVAQHLDYIRIDFFVVFNDNDKFKNRNRFLKRFGLAPVIYSNFNQTVTFAITDLDKFATFVNLLEQFINSRTDVHPSNTDYSIITIIKDFVFLSRERIVQEGAEGDVFISLINPPIEVRPVFEEILTQLVEQIKTYQEQQYIGSFSSDSETIIQIKAASLKVIDTLADNFDIINRIQSLRTPTIREINYQPQLTWNIDIDPPPYNQVMIGILDNGVRDIPPLSRIIRDMGLDITARPANALNAHNPHGTVVASLAAIGLDYFNHDRNKFTADAWIVPIKILDFATGSFNPKDIEDIIKSGIRNGIKIFNLSVSGPSKNYNSSFSEYAYLLDRLAFEYDILIFIATGNLSYDDIDAMLAEDPNGLHSYPNHFYNPNKSSDSHVCEATNICIPSESMNNITVGAIAENGDPLSQSDLTPFKELPAYYTRKYHVDYLRKVNGTFFSLSQQNWRINKPDIVMPGGDLRNNNSGMQVMGFGLQGNDFYYKDAGTSLASPLAANLAAKILNIYPRLNMQSVKALILNSSEKLLSEEFLNTVVEDVRKEESVKLYGKDYDYLEDKQRSELNGLINAKNIYHRLVGFGKPDVEKALYSSPKSLLFVIQDSISCDTYKAINVNIPSYLLDYSRSSYILKIKATLCYKFLPVYYNHLSYNPLHVSFNITRSLEKDNPARTAEIVSNRNDPFFKQYYEDGYDDKKRTEARNKAMGVKSTIQSWSEDFFPRSNKPFSNVQTIELNINRDEIAKINNQLTIVVRSTCKNDLDQNFVDWLKRTPHEFSIAMRITEKNNDQLQSNLYDEMNLINELDILYVNLEGTTDATLDAEL